MAPARQIKSLNKAYAGPGTKRFVFKSFAQRVSSVDVDVFRSLVPVKFEPTAGTSFFHESLLQWRELNTAADFNLLYGELYPLVQSLPQLLLHKKTVVQALLSRMHMGALLSLEPILSLIAVLSRDLREEFLPFVAPFLSASLKLLDDGADREPDVLEQIFTSVSYVFKHLVKYLAKDLTQALKYTRLIRYHRREYVRDFAAEAVSFLFRNAPLKQLVKGVRHLLKEVQKNPTEEKVTGAGALLAHALKGAKGGLHSKAPELLQLLLDRTTLNGGVTSLAETVGEEPPGKEENAEASVSVVAEAIELVCQNTSREKSGVLWECLLEEVNGLLQMAKVKQATSTDVARAVHLLNNAVEHHRGSRVLDYRPLFSLAQNLLQSSFFAGAAEDSSEQGLEANRPSLPKETLRLILALIASHERIAGASQGPSSVSRAASTWQPAFDSAKPQTLFPFLEAMLAPSRAYALPFFVGSILGGLDRLIAAHPTAVLPLLLAVCKRMESSPTPLLSGNSKYSNLVEWLQRKVAEYKGETKQGLAEVWAAVQLLPQAMGDADAGAERVWGLVQKVRAQMEEERGTVDERLLSNGQATTSLSTMESGSLEHTQPASKLKLHLETLLAAALKVHTTFLQRSKQFSFVKFVEDYLETAKAAHRSPHVMAAVADLLELVRGNAKNASKVQHLLSQDEGLAYVELLHENLRSPVKQLRVATLRVLACFDPLAMLVAEKKEETQLGKVGQKRKKEETTGGEPCELFKQLLEIESSPLTLEDCRHSSSIITRLRVQAAANRLPAAYHKPLAQAMLGVLRIRFSLLWDAARDDLAALLQKEEEARGQHGVKPPLVVWPAVFADLQETQTAWLNGQDLHARAPAEEEEEGKEEGVQDLETAFTSASSALPDGTDLPTVVGLLLKTLQHVPLVAEAHSRQVVPLLLDFAEIPTSKSYDAADEDFKHKSFDAANNSQGTGIKDEKKGSSLWGSKPWREGLKQWLSLLEEMRNARALFRSAELKQMLLDRLLLDSDPAIQQLALSCLLNWKDPQLVPYAENLQRLVAPKSARDEITHWDIGQDAGLISDEHREGLMKVVIHIMYPKLKKKATKQTSKATAGVPRAAVLGFLARLSAQELAPFFKLLLLPLSAAFRKRSSGEVDSETWEEELRKGVSALFLERVDPDALATIPYKRRIGFLHMARELIDTWGESLLGSYLHALLGVTVRILEIVGRSGGVEDEAKEGGVEGKVATAGQLGLEDGSLMELASTKEEADIEESLNHEEEEQQENGSKTASAGSEKDLRSLSLRVLSSVLSRFPALVAPKADVPKSQNPQSYWDLFFAAMKGQISRIRNDTASSDKPSALLTCFLAISRNSDLAPLLQTNSQLLPGLLSILSVKGASQNVLGVVLSIVENLLELDSDPATENMLLPNLPVLLTNLQQLLTLQRDHPVSGKSRKPNFKRELSILVNVSQHVTGGDAAAQLTSALMPLLRSPGGKRKVDEEACTAALRVLEGLGAQLDAVSVDDCVPVLAPLFITLQSREARKALSGALEGLAKAGQVSLDQEPAAFEDAVQSKDEISGNFEVRVTQGYGTRSAEVKLGLQNIAGLLSDLNAMDPTTIDECDYGRRLDAYSRLESGAFEGMTRLETQLILSQCLHDMQEEDLSLRHSAAHAIEVFLRHAAKKVQEDGIKDLDGFAADSPEEDDVILADVSKVVAPSVTNGSLADVSKVGDPSETNGKAFEGEVNANEKRLKELQKVADKSLDAEGAVSLVTRLLLPHVRKGLAHETLVVRREYVLLFREMISQLPGIPSLRELQCLLSSDLEADVFHNIVHLQVHRRIRAISRFRVLCEEGNFHQGSLMTIFVPLFSQSLFEAKGDKEGNLVEAAVGSIATMASQLEWGTYYGLLMRLFKLTSGKGVPHQRAIVRAICGVLERFHFSMEEEASGEEINHRMEEEGEKQEGGKAEGTGVQAEGSAEVAKEQDLTEVKKSAGVKSSGGKVVPSEIQALLLRRVFPELRKSMIEPPEKKGEDGLVSTPVTLALVQVLLLLPPRAMEVELPRLLHEVANLLKSRAQWVRDAARGALVGVSQILGAKYLHFLVETLSSSLTRGYQVHVLGYTLHAVLVKTIPLVNSGDIDYCLAAMTPIIEEDILGEAGEEKDVEGLAKKMKETKHTMSYESLRLLAQAGGFAAVCRELVGLVKTNLVKSLNPKVKAKLDEMLRNIASGLIQNAAAAGLEVLVLTHGLVEEGLKWETEQAASKRKKKEDNQARSTGGNFRTILDKVGTSLGKGIALEEEQSVPNQQMLVEFALQLMHSCFKRNKINGSDSALAPVLDPMVELLNRCLDSRHDAVLSLAMKNLGYLVRTPLTQMRTAEPEIADRLFAIVRRSGRSSSPLLQESLKLLTTLLRFGKTCKFSEAQLRVILTAPVFVDLEENTTRATAFGLLKAIIGRKLVVPEMYDLMTRVGQLMVRSQDTNVRKLCSETLLQFLLDFPLGQRRLQQHLEFLAANLAYEHPSGREAALEMIHAVVMKFPPQLVDENADFFFLPLVTRLVNDENQQVRAMVGAVLNVLVTRVGAQARQRILDFAMAWYAGERRELWRPAAQVLGIGVEVLGPAFKKLVPAWLAATLSILDHCRDAVDEEATDGSDSASEAAPMWQEAYFTLTSAEKVLQKLPELVLSGSFQAFWQHVFELLLHRHLWVRKAAGRLLGGLFAALPQPANIPPETILALPEGLQRIAASLCQQLEAEVVDEKLAEQAVKNLVYIAAAMHEILEKDEPSKGFENGVNGLQEGVNGLQNRVNGPDRHAEEDGLAEGQENGLADSEGEDDVDEKRPSDGGRWHRDRCPTLKSLFRRIARIALAVESIQSSAALRWFAAVTARLGGSVAASYLPEMVVPLYRLAEGNAAKTVPADLKTLAEEVMGLVRDTVGVTLFVSTYNTVRQNVKVTRDDRKRKAAIAALVDTERVAKKKIAAGHKRQAQKKRKIEEHRRVGGRARR